MATQPFILCVDDQKDVLDTLATQLENSAFGSEFQFEYSESGSELLEIMDELQNEGQQVAVVISDQIMPQMQGCELLSRVHERSPQTKKILLTGESRMEAVIQAINQAELYRFIAKPWDKVDLLLTVEEAARAFVRKSEHDAQNRLLQSLYDCSQVLSSSNDLDQLIEGVMRQVLRQTQATRGCLILLNNQGLLQVHTFLGSVGDAHSTLPTFAPDTSRQIPYSIVDYVISRKQAYSCANVSTHQADEWLLREPYIRHHRPKSLICLPLLLHGELVGLLYLEHSHRVAAFSEDVQRFLNHLAPNLSVSLHNARLYADLCIKKDKIAEQKQALEEQMHELRESIAATRRIQDALLPKLDELQTFFADAALIYRPRDVISGDFVWYRRIGDELILAVGDCTGHGVPGAMLTVLGCNLLDRITAETGVYAPACILARLDQLIIDTLRQEHRAVSEGMDIAIIHYNRQTRRLTFAGANRPLYHLRADDLTEIKGNRWGVGGYETEVKTYEEHSYTLKADDRLFLFTDGIVDQFGGPTQDRKFTARRLRQHLTESNRYPLGQSLKELELYLDAWQGSTPQTDDILVVGLTC